MNLNVYISFACFFCCHGWIFLITSKSCHGEDEEVQQRWGCLLACIYCNPLLRLRMTRVWWIAYDSCTTTYDLACSSAFCVVFYLNGSKAIPGLISWRQVFFHLQKQRSHPNMQLGLTSTEHLRIIINLLLCGKLNGRMSTMTAGSCRQAPGTTLPQTPWEPWPCNRHAANTPCFHSFNFPRLTFVVDTLWCI